MTITLDQAKRIYRPWRCDNGTYDFTDITLGCDEDCDVGFTNLGNGKDIESAWADLLAILND